MCYPVALPLTYLHFAVLVVIDITIEKTAARVSQHMSHKRCMHPSRQWIFGHMHGAVFTIVRIHRDFKREDFKLKMTPYDMPNFRTCHFSIQVQHEMFHAVLHTSHTKVHVVIKNIISFNSLMYKFIDPKIILYTVWHC